MMIIPNIIIIIKTNTIKKSQRLISPFSFPPHPLFLRSDHFFILPLFPSFRPEEILRCAQVRGRAHVGRHLLRLPAYATTPFLFLLFPASCHGDEGTDEAGFQVGVLGGGG